MTNSFSLPQEVKMVMLYQGVADGVTCDVVSMKNFHKGWFVVTHTGSSDTDLTLSLYEATDVAAGTNAAITTAQPLWLNTTLGTSGDTLTRSTDAYSYTINTTAAGDRAQMVVFEIDPAILSAGYDCVYLADSGGHNSNLVNITFFGVPRFTQATLASAIID